MEDFTELSALYNDLEKNALNYKFPNQIANLFQKLRDIKYKEKKFNEAEKAQWEMDFFNFVIEDGNIKPLIIQTNEKGDLIEYPSLARFDEKTCKYLINRLKNTSNSLLKARYGIILWCSPKKHGKYGKISVDSNLNLIKFYEDKDKKEPSNHYGLDIITTLKNAYIIAINIKYKEDKVKSEIIRLVKIFNSKSTSSFALRAGLIVLMLNDKKNFLKNDFKGIEKICWQTSQALVKSGNIHNSIRMLELGERIDKKLGDKNHEWRKKIAEFYEMLMNQSEKGNNLAALSFCQNALQNYKSLKMNEKIKEMENKYSELKKSMKFKEIKTEVDLSGHIQKCKEVAKRIVQKDSDEIIKILMHDNNILPKYNDMERLAEEVDKSAVLQQIIPVEIVDQGGHPSQHFFGYDEKKYFGILQQYDMELKLNKNFLIREIIFAAVKENKFSYDILLDFLYRSSWYGKDISKTIGGETITYNWLNLIDPSFREYFNQILHYFINEKNYPNMVLCIDSLVLKMEGLLRDMCQFLGITTFYTTTDIKGRNIVREKDIHTLLYEKQIKEFFNKDDLLFLRFLLVEKAGYNLRHRIAHALMSYREYNIDYMHLLLLALLRLGKYKFVKKIDGDFNGINFIEKKYVRYYLGNKSIRTHIDAVHAAPPKADKFTDKIVEEVVKRTNCNGIIAVVSRTIADLNRPPDSSNKDAICEYRKIIKTILEHIGILDKNSKLVTPYLHLAIHGMKDRKDKDIELGTNHGKTCSPNVRDWFVKNFTDKCHKLISKDIKIVLDKQFTGDVSKSYHRKGDKLTKYIGYGENFNTIQIEICRSLRENNLNELIVIFTELIKDFNEKFP